MWGDHLSITLTAEDNEDANILEQIEEQGEIKVAVVEYVPNVQGKRIMNLKLVAEKLTITKKNTRGENK